MCYGPEFAARAVRDWLGKVGVKTLFIEPGSPWENGYIESFNARLRNELLDGEIFYTPEEVHVISGWWREHYNKIRPHSALGNRPPAPQAILPNVADRLRCATPLAYLGGGACYELTSRPDHSSQAVQGIVEALVWM
jgi:putative transposase